MEFRENVMHFSTFRVRDYKSFHDSGDVQLDAGFNVIVGPNNVGKTALLEALSLQFWNRPHRSPRTAPNATSILASNSNVSVTFLIERDQLTRILADTGQPFHVPRVLEVGTGVDSNPSRFIEIYLEQEAFSIAATYGPDGPVSFSMSGFNYGIAGSEADNRSFAFTVDRETQQPVFVDEGHCQVDHMLPTQLATLLRRRPFLVKAQRPIPGTAHINDSTELDPDGTNLATVLHRLKNQNPGRWARLITAVNQVLPEIRDISFNFPSNSAEIRLWSVDPTTERADLSISLEESGSGIGQILAMLYLGIASEAPRILLIDEPQSFLHPGAIRKTLEILRSGPMDHQYVITTHSPTVINAAEPVMILNLQKVEAETQISSLDLANREKLRDYLTQVGARLSDVFGMDCILWVEGSTEETCIPIILSHFEVRSPLGLTVLGVVSPGDFEGGAQDLVLKIYNRLSGQRTLLPPSIGFIFDSEDRRDLHKEDLRRMGRQISERFGDDPDKELVYFIPRRMYENYLLNPEVIARFLTEQIQDCDIERETVLPEEVVAWLRDHKWDVTFIEDGEQSEERWQREVHAAKVLRAITTHFSESTVDYFNYKVIFGKRLTELTLEQCPGEFGELVRVLQDALGAG